MRSWCGGWARGGWANTDAAAYSYARDPELAAVAIFFAAAALDVVNSVAGAAAVFGAAPMRGGEGRLQSSMDHIVAALYLVDGAAYFCWWHVESAAERAQKEAAAAAAAAAEGAASDVSGSDSSCGDGGSAEEDPYDVLGAAARFCATRDPRALGLWDFLPALKEPP